MTRAGRPLRAVLAMVLAAMLGGCSTASSLLEGKKIDYKSAGQLPPLEIPPDLTTPTRDNRYTVPDTGKGSATLSGYQADRAQQAKLGPQSGVLPSVDKMRIERAGTQRWLVVKGEPVSLWPAVKDFWQESGFIVNVEMPEAGVMKTDWAENRAKLPQERGDLPAVIARVVDHVLQHVREHRFHFLSGERDVTQFAIELVR